MLRKHRTLDAALVTPAMSQLEPRDAGFARAIAVETLRRFGQLEALIRHFVPKTPAAHKSGATLEILYAGACELLFLDVAPHAAVDAANRLAQEDAKAVHFKALINAVLRRVAREGRDVLAGIDVALNAPDYLWSRWKENYGEGAAREIVTAHTSRPPLDLTVLTPTPELQGTELAPDCLRLHDAGRVDLLPGYAQGHWFVQDFAASLPARLLGDFRDSEVIDLCSAPGGKTAQLAARGAILTSLDLSRERLRLVEENLARLKLTARPVAADARDWRPEKPASFVLLDAPCTATGTIRRHPDIPWIKTAADISMVTSLQAELLEAAASMTAPGGTLVYAVCSLEPEEGVDQVDAFLNAHPEFTRVPVSAEEVFDAAFVTENGDVRTLPCHWAEKGGMDGFFAARLRRAG